jgi:hypothetical protein
MPNNALLIKGYECLMDKLGLVEAERFIVLVNREPFDYTEWRRDNLFTDMTLEELSAAAQKHCDENGLTIQRGSGR